MPKNTLLLSVVRKGLCVNSDVGQAVQYASGHCEQNINNQRPKVATQKESSIIRAPCHDSKEATS